MPESLMMVFEFCESTIENDLLFLCEFSPSFDETWFECIEECGGQRAIKNTYQFVLLVLISYAVVKRIL